MTIKLENMINNAFGPKKMDDGFNYEANQEELNKIKQIENKIKTWEAQSITEKKISLNLRNAQSLYDELENLANELTQEKSLKDDAMRRKNALRRIGEAEEEFFSSFDVLAWPELKGQTRIGEEQKAEQFLQTMFFDQIEQIKKDRESYGEKNVGQLAGVLSKLAYPLHRLDYGTELQDNSPNLAKEWLNNLKIHELIDANVYLMQRGLFNLIQTDSLELLFKQDKEYAAEKILELIVTNRFEGFNQTWLIVAFTDLIGAETARQKINEAIIKTTDQTEINNLEYARAFFTPNHDKIAITNLQNFYQEKIKFEEYGLNDKMMEKEIELLRDLLGEDKSNHRQGGAGKVLEMGCGPGRLIEKLVEGNYDVTGFDNVPRHTQITKEKIEKLGKPAKVFEGDWHHNAIKDESFDTVYSLGRNILHDYSLPDQVQLFREAARILKKGGQFIFDIPDRDKGKYKLMVEAYKEEMEKRAIRNFRYGSIYDSPDGKNFATRYAYSNEDIKQLSALAGFKIKEPRRIPLETGADDENIYYVSEKI